MADDGRVLQIFEDGRRRRRDRQIQLPATAQATPETVAEMVKIVRKDAALPDLKNFAFHVCIGRDKRELTDQIDAAFRFARDDIEYLPEAPGTETVADLWSCMYGIDTRPPLDSRPVGDCVLKSVALATLLAFCSLKPLFIAIRQLPDTEFFDHVFVGLRRTDGSIEALDPTPPEFQRGHELPSFNKLIFEIFEP